MAPVQQQVARAEVPVADAGSQGRRAQVVAGGLRAVQGLFWRLLIPRQDSFSTINGTHLRIPEKQKAPETLGSRGFVRMGVGDIGLEHDRFLPGNTVIVPDGGAQSGAQSAPDVGDPLLAVIVNAWPRLTEEQRLRVIAAAMVDPAGEIVAPRCDK